jgi:hypothetical protein
MDDPRVLRIIKTGYPKEFSEGFENVVIQPEFNGFDFYNSEIIEGDQIAIDLDNFEAVILKEHLKRYCMEQLQFRFDRGWVFEKDDMFRERWLEQVLHEQYNFKFTIAE